MRPSRSAPHHRLQMLLVSSRSISGCRFSQKQNALVNKSAGQNSKIATWCSLFLSVFPILGMTHCSFLQKKTLVLHDIARRCGSAQRERSWIVTESW